jgi:K+-sensing histidine kinase KdpD
MAAKAINTSGKRLHKTLNNLIDLVRLRHYTPTATQQQEPVNINDVVENIVADRADYHNFNNNIQTNFCGDSQVPVIQEDLNIIVFELLDNVFKFTTPNSVPSISLKITDDKALISLNVSNESYVSATCFSKNDIGPFKQYNRSEIEQQGSGLGLYLVQLITEKYNGNLSIDASIPNIFNVSVYLPIVS